MLATARGALLCTLLAAAAPLSAADDGTACAQSFLALGSPTDASFPTGKALCSVISSLEKCLENVVGPPNPLAAGVLANAASNPNAVGCETVAAISRRSVR